MLLYIICKKNEHGEKSLALQAIAIIAVFGVITFAHYKEMVEAYKENEAVYYDNIQRIENYKQQGNWKEPLYLRKPTYEAYSFTPLVGTKWVEEDVKAYFELDENTIIKEERYLNQEEDATIIITPQK